MKNILKLSNFNRRQADFQKFRISLASPNEIRSWSSGEVKKAETINYRTLKPERDGLFCARIFGPVKDYECICGRYKRVKHRGVVCEKCGVDVTVAEVRRERMGHIELASPVAHVWFLRLLPSRIGLFLDIPLRGVEEVLYFEKCVVVNPKMTDLVVGQTLTEDEHRIKHEQFFGQFVVKWGAEALLSLIQQVDLEAESARLSEEMTKTNSEIKLKKLVKRYKLLQSFINTDSKPEWMILTVLPVLPPDLRPLIPLDNGGRFVTSDLNDLYRRVINRNIRLKRLLSLGAPEIIVRNEKRMLQEAVDALFDNGRKGRPVTGTNSKRPLKSLTDMLKGKQGRFRQNLLGKRVDYSGRSVIVVGPELRLHQCGLPKEMALELFKPFVYHELQKNGMANSFKSAKHLVEILAPEVWDVLEAVIREHPVLLNRAPTLHRLGVQAFEPILIEGKAIQLHPLVCTAFNADFDGDQMAVHLPISVEAQMEARVLMMSTNNILSPANGRPIINADQDIVLGIYYLTRERKAAPGEGRRFGSVEELLFAYEARQVELHAKVSVRLTQGQQGSMESIMADDLSDPLASTLIETTVGRVLLFHELGYDLPFEKINLELDKKSIARMIDSIYREFGMKRTVLLADRLKEIGFKYATRSGLSVGIKDFVEPKEKQPIVEKTQGLVKALEESFIQGLVTQEEKHNKIINMWTRAADEIGEHMIQALSTETREGLDGKGKSIKIEDRSFNPVYIMLDSGARGSSAQARQLSGIRGLMAKPDGSIIETPIVSNFRGGLTVTEFFTSTHGARKGLADTALKTASSGYLTRRLVDVAQDSVVVEQDCEATEGIAIHPVIEGRELLVPLSRLALGRVLAKPAVDGNGKEVLPAGTYLSETEIEIIEQSGLDQLEVRSVITCRLHSGVCRKCYGRDLARGRLVEIGEAVGAVAAQSIGEPGTQLTMRTFHVGGAASQGVVEDSITVKNGGKLKFYNLKSVETQEGYQAVTTRVATVAVLDRQGRRSEYYRIPYGATLYSKDGEQVEPGAVILAWDPHNRIVLSEFSGQVALQDVVEGLTAIESFDEITGIGSTQILPVKSRPASGKELRPCLVLTVEGQSPVTYFLEDGAVLNVLDQTAVHSGSVLARVPQESSRTRDITGGLPRVEDLLEARSPKVPAILAPVEGIVNFGNTTQERVRLQIMDRETNELLSEMLIPKWRQLNVYTGFHVERGEVISDGESDPHDILAYMGVNALAQHMIDEVQAVYRLQGVEINNKHIEVIVRQMLRRVEVMNPGQSEGLIRGEYLESKEVHKINEELIAEGKEPVVFRPILLGITKSSLTTSSFISAASFQETTRVLTDAAIRGATDSLVGLKENVMLGRLVPVGTGFHHHKERAKQLEQAQVAQAAKSQPVDYESLLEKEMSKIAREDEF